MVEDRRVVITKGVQGTQPGDGDDGAAVAVAMFAKKTEQIELESQLDGIYIIRTSEPTGTITSSDAVRAYKSLGQVEQAFRCIKEAGLHIRPIRHRTEDHVRAHVFLCMLTYYVMWHMRKALSTILFQDDSLDSDRWTRDPVAKARPSRTAREKKITKQNSEGWPVHSFQTLMDELATQCRNTCRVGEGPNAVRFSMLTEPTPLQSHVFGLLATIKPRRFVSSNHAVEICITSWGDMDLRGHTGWNFGLERLSGAMWRSSGYALPQPSLRGALFARRGNPPGTRKKSLKTHLPGY